MWTGRAENIVFAKFWCYSESNYEKNSVLLICMFNSEYHRRNRKIKHVKIKTLSKDKLSLTLVCVASLLPSPVSEQNPILPGATCLY